MNIDNLHIGMKVYYRLEYGNLTRFIPVVILSKGVKRVVVRERDRVDGMKRIVSPENIFPFLP